MRQFASTGFRLWNLGTAAKLLYSAFCLMTLLGVVSSALYYGDLVGSGTAGVRRYYAGQGGEGEAAARPPTVGPAIDVPDEAEHGHPPIVVAVTYRKLFTMPVVLLIVGHLFLATGLGERAKLAWLVAASASVVGHLATPWLVRYGGGRLAFLHPVTGIALTVTMTMLTVYPVIAMWRGEKTPPRAGASAS
jgi:hypothetical protein